VTGTSLKTRILLPLIGALALLLAGFAVATYCLERAEIESEIADRLHFVDALFRRKSERDAEAMSAIVEVLEKDATLAKHMAARDREALLAYCAPIARDLRERHGITHTCFHAPDRRNFLRVYDPDDYGDLVDRFTMRAAAQSGRPSHGIEIGNLGTLTLRVVHPWIVGDEMIGFIELGKEIGHITPEIHEILGVEIFVSIDKERLDQKRWEEGRDLFGVGGRWNELPRVVVADRTLEEIPPEAAEFLSAPHERRVRSGKAIRLGDRIYRLGLVPLSDAGNRPIGDILVLHDVTELRGNLRRLAVAVTLGCAGVGAALVVFFLLLLRRAESRLGEAAGRALAESQAREAAQAEHAERMGQANVTLEAQARQLAAQAKALLQANEDLAAEIAERQRTDRKLKEHLERLQTLIDAIPVPVFLKDTRGVYQSCNKAFEEVIGIAKRDLIGKTVLDTARPETAGKHQEMDDALLREPGIQTYEAPVRYADGTTHDVAFSKATFRGSDGNVSGMVGIMLDITERTRQEKELRQAKEAAEQANRDLAEANAHLERITLLAGEMAQQAEMASASKSEFVANMSHEIRTPMNGIIGMIDLLLDTDLNSEQTEYAGIVRNSANVLMAIIDDILDFSKIEAGKLSIEPIPFDLRVAMEEMAALMAPRAEEKGIELAVRYPPAAPHRVVGDPGRTRQILTNFLTNAIKFTEKGRVILEAELLERSDEHVSLRLSVEDTGIGIPEGKLEHIFGKFTQADASTTRKYGGTGLGLAIARQLAELMGGRTGAASREGEGSKFWFDVRFPIDRSTPPAPLPPVTMSGVRVLIVDPSEINRRVLAEQTSSWGMRADAFSETQDALQALRSARQAEDPYLVAILDPRGLEGDGARGAGRGEIGRFTDLAGVIRSDPDLCAFTDAADGTRLILLTSAAQRGDAKRAVEAGFCGYLARPVRQSDLLECLIAALQRNEDQGPRTLITRHTLAESRVASEEEQPPPLAPAEDAMGPEELEPAASAALSRPAARILVVEDNVVNQRVAVHMLRKGGYSFCDVASNGLEALEALEKRSYDLILMDCQMPEMDGYEATREIRKREQALADGVGEGERGETRHTPILAMTAHAMAGDREMCLAAGMDGYMSKPIDPKSLFATLREFLSPSDSGAPASSPLPQEKPRKPPTETVLDTKETLDRLGGDRDLLETIHRVFLEDAPLQISKLREALEANDAAVAERRAHTIKGASANIGATAMRERASKMELAARDGDLDQVGSLLDGLQEEFERVRTAIQGRAEPRGPRF